MTSSERVLLALQHKEADRVAITDGPWETTIQRWHREGLPEGVGPAEYFDYEFAGVSPDLSLRLPSKVVEETDEYVTAWDANGALRRNWKHATSTPECIDFTITSRELWEEHRECTKFVPERIDIEGGLKAQAAARASGKFWHYAGAMGYDKTQGIVGSQRLLIAIVEDPEWAADLFMTSARMIVESAEEMMGAGFEFDGAFLYDDMGYRNALLFSPRCYREVCFPAHKHACNFFNSKGLPIILHSCGCVREIVAELIETGFTCLQPLEVKAGMDLIELKRSFGDRLAFMGGIDVRAMAHPDPAVIEKEISHKIPFAKQGGGYIYHSDHSVPDNVSFEQYKHVIELVHQHGRYD